jgi:RNA polymerase sigma-70 factor (ECF subfamily)
MSSAEPFFQRDRSHAAFATTRWSVVLSAGDRSSPDAESALEMLCQTYWYPLYAFARRRGSSPEDSANLTQEFFSRLLEQEFLLAADREKGRFRSFLLTVFKRFLSKERDRAQTQKRGGGRRMLSIDVEVGEQRYGYEPSDD